MTINLNQSLAFKRRHIRTLLQHNEGRRYDELTDVILKYFEKLWTIGRQKKNDFLIDKSFFIRDYFLNKAKLNFGIEAQLTNGLVLLGLKSAFCGTDPMVGATEQRNLAIVKRSISCS